MESRPASQMHAHNPILAAVVTNTELSPTCCLSPHAEKSSKRRGRLKDLKDVLADRPSSPPGVFIAPPPPRPSTFLITFQSVMVCGA
eukprot:4416122-Pleurochrysis_carterae.AAC.4